MVKKIYVLLVLSILLTGCAGKQNNVATDNIGAKGSDIVTDLTEGEQADSDVKQQVSEQGDSNQNGESEVTEVPVTGLSKKYDIEFEYSNYLYQYDLNAKWNSVEINATPIKYISGLEVLLDGTPFMFESCDIDHSGSITPDEWTEYEQEIIFNILDLNNDGKSELDEFGHFTAQLAGIELEADSYSITDSGLEDYAIQMEDEIAPVSLKILRAGEGGFMAAEGINFPEGTIFIELVSEFDIVLAEMPDFEMGPGFTTPLLSMFLEEDYEENNHGALGFSSIVNTDAFNAIFGGDVFELHYEGQGDTGIMDEYHLTITPLS